MQPSQIHPSVSMQPVTSDFCNIRTMTGTRRVTPPKHMEVQHFVSKIERLGKLHARKRGIMLQ
jgi:hypothetical protein